MGNKFLRNLARALPGAAQGFMQGRKFMRDEALQDENLRAKKIDTLTKQFESGLQENETGIGVNPDFLNPETDVYKRDNRLAELKRLAAASGKGAGAPVLTGGQIMGLKEALANGKPLSPDLAELPVGSGYSNFFPAPKPAGATLTNEQVYAHLGKPIPTGIDPAGSFSEKYLPLVKPPGAGTPAATPEQQSLYEQTLKLPPGSARGLTVGQFTSGMTNVRTQDNIANRQQTAIGAADARQEKSLTQNANQFGTNLEMKKEELERNKAKDKEAQLQKFQDDYQKTGVLAAIAPLSMLDKSTGVLTGKKTDRSKLPGYGTNALRQIPLIGNAAATLAAKRYGGEAEAQALQTLMNSQIRTMSGQAVTKYEEGRNLLAAGMGPGGNEADVERGIKMMYEGLVEADRSARAAYTPDVVDMYSQRGGQGPIETLFKQSPNKSRDRAESAKKLSISQKKLDMIDATPVKRQYSPSRNKTKLIYADGREEIVDGKK